MGGKKDQRAERAAAAQMARELDQTSADDKVARLAEWTLSEECVPRLDCVSPGRKQGSKPPTGECATSAGGPHRKSWPTWMQDRSMI